MQETQEMQDWSLGQEDPLEEEMATSPVFLLGKFHGQRTWQTTVLGVTKSWIRLSTHVLMDQLMYQLWASYTLKKKKKKVNYSRLYSWYLNNAWTGVRSANPPQSRKSTYNLLMKIINKQSIIGIEKNFIWAKLKTMPRKHRFKKQLNCVLLNYKMGVGGFYFIKTKLTKLC